VNSWLEEIAPKPVKEEEEEEEDQEEEEEEEDEDGYMRNPNRADD